MTSSSCHKVGSSIRAQESTLLSFSKAADSDVQRERDMLIFSRKDQEQYWADRSKPYEYISVSQFAELFKQFHVGLRLQDELSVAFNKSRSHKSALVFKKYLVPKKELFKAFDSFAHLPMTVERLPVIYKQRDLLFHPPWAFTLPTFLLGVPITVVESTVWTVMTYYVIGFAPEVSRFFKQFLMTFLIQQMAGALFRFIASVCRTMTIANTGGVLLMEAAFLVGGFILPHSGGKELNFKTEYSQSTWGQFKSFNIATIAFHR